MLNEQYIVNNISFLHPTSDRYSGNHCDKIGVALNNINNTAYTYKDIIQSIEIGNLIGDDDLYVVGFDLDEYDDNFFNLHVFFKSKSKRDLLGLMREFSDNKAMLLMDFERRGIVLCKDSNEISKVKKAYPVAIQVELQDTRYQEEYIVHHNFYNAMLKMYKYDNKYFLHLTNSRHHPIIINLVMDNFGENVLMGDTKEELLERFYNGFT